MNKQLKPCPWNCGKPSQITKMVNLGRWSFLHRCPIVGPISFTCTTEEGCALEWNTRPTHDALVAALKRVLSIEPMGCYCGLVDSSIQCDTCQANAALKSAGEL